MRKIVNIIFAALCSAAVLSCTKEASVKVDGPIRFTISTDPLIETKAFPDSEDAVRENQINTVDFFIYSGANLSSAAYAGHLETDAVHEKEFVVDMTGADYAALIADGTPLLYAVVNLPKGVHIPATASLDAVKNTVAVADFVSRDSQLGLVMSGQQKLLYDDGGASCHIVVGRIAAKLSFDITAKECVNEDPDDLSSTEWYSHPEAMTIELMNMGSQSILDGGVSAVSNSELFDYPEGALRNQYYTYPREWKAGADDEPYLLISMPVTRGSVDGERRDCFYKVMLPNTSFESNHWYKYAIDLKVIGSFDRFIPQVPTPEDAVFFVYQWGGANNYEGVTTEGQITGFRYLVVEENSPTKVYYMYNVNTLSIPFKTSHACVIDSKSATSPDFTSSSTFNRTSEMSVTIDGSNIKISHALNNDTSSGQGYSSTNKSGYDYAPITLTFKIHHSTGSASEDALYSETIRVVQYPALYIEAFPNSKPDTKGGVFVNGSQADKTTSTVAPYYSTNLGGVNGLSGTGNQNPNMYVVTTTVLSIDGMLGDPRGSSATLTGSSSLKPIEGGANRNVNYYYLPPSNGLRDDFIAPKFRVASSFGVTGRLTYPNAQYRCATYQEDGYPGGRWRMPTKAEVRYINKLSNDGVFEALFSENTIYWCANGFVYNGKTHDSTSVSYDETNGFENGVYEDGTYVRCVYDEWYWENTAYPRIPAGSRTTPMWGDAPIL